MKLFSIALLALAPFLTGPEQLTLRQPVELIEEIKPHEYTQRTVEVELMSDATATVCLRGLDVPKDTNLAQCFYKMHDSAEIVVIQSHILGEMRI